MCLYYSPIYVWVSPMVSFPQVSPPKLTNKMQISKINILIFNFDVFYRFEPKGLIRIEHTFLPTRLLMLMHVQRTHTVTVYTTVFLKMNTQVRNM